MLRQLTDSLSEILSRLQNDLSEASEKCGYGGLRWGRTGRKRQWGYSPPGSWLNSSLDSF